MGNDDRVRDSAAIEAVLLLLLLMDADNESLKMQTQEKEGVEEVEVLETEDGERCCSCCGCHGDCCQKGHHPIGRRGKRCAVRFSRLCLIIPNLLFVVSSLNVVT